MFKRYLCVFSWVLFVAASVASAQTAYQVDPQHSAANFTVRHMMVSNVHGQFAGIKGTLLLDENNVANSRIDATLDAATINTGNASRDNELRGQKFFDVASFPTLHFVSTKVESAGAGKLRVSGDLTMHGVTKPVVLDVEGPGPAMSTPQGKRVGVTATTKLSRKDFGITWNPTLDGGGVVVSDEVAIELDLEFVNRPASGAGK